MGKKSTKVLSGALATTSLLSGVMGAAPAFAATNIDAMYKSAFDAVMKAKEDKSQESITAARKAIGELTKHKELKGFVGEFSKQTDAVQQKLFEDFYSLLFVDGKKKDKISQSDVNKAREFVTAFDTFEGNKQYTASWSTAVDGFQQVLVVEAHDAVVKAMTSKNEKDLKVAEELVKVLATSTNEQTKQKATELTAIAKEVQKEIDKQKEESGLKVELINSISTTEVTIVLAEKPAADLTADKFVVKANGTDVKVEKAEKKAADLTGKTYKLTIASIDKKEGKLSVNGTEKSFDFKAPEVKGIEVKDTTHIVVNFNEELNEDSLTVANFKIKKVADDAALANVQKVVLNADKQSVTVTLATALVPADYLLSLGDTTVNPKTTVQDVAKNGIYAGTEVSFRPTAAQLENKVAPKLAKATYNQGTGLLSLTFDKNITDAKLDTTKLSINGVALTANDVNVDGSANDNVVVVRLSEDSKKAVNALAGDLKLTAAKGAYGDDTMTEGETFAILKEDPAVVKSLSYNQETNMLTVIFDKAVTLENATTLSIDDTDENHSAEITKAMAKDAKGNALDTTKANATWTFDCTPVAGTIEGMTVANLKAYIAAGAVKNEAKVANVVGQETYATGVKVAFVKDEVKPSIVSAEYNNNTEKLVLTFSEKVSVEAANLTLANIKLFTADGTALANFANLDGKAIAENTADANQTSKTFTFDLSGANNEKAALDLANKTGKKVTFVMDANAVTDEANLKNDATTYAKGVVMTYNDYKKPELVANGVTITNQNLIAVKFAESVEKTTAENVNNYVITEATGAKLAVTKATVQPVAADGTMTVLLTTANQVNGKPYTLTINNVKDLAGNIMEEKVNKFNGVAVEDAEKLTVDGLAVAAPVNSKNDTLTVAFNAAVEPVKAVDLNNYVVLEADANNDAAWDAAKQISLTNAKAELRDSTHVKITLDAANLQNNKFYKVVASNLTTVTGKALGTANGDADALVQLTGVAAPVAPAITETNTAKGAIKLVFAEELVGADVAANYTVAGKTVTKATYAWDGKEATVVLDLNEALTAATDVVLKGGNGATEIKNLAGVSFANATINAAAIGDKVAPTVDKVEAQNPSGMSNDVITVSFKDQDILNVAANYDAAKFTLVDTTTGKTIDLSKNATIALNKANPDTITITFGQIGGVDNTVNLQSDHVYTLTVKDIMDTSGNKLAEVTKNVTWVTGANHDIVAPTIAANGIAVTADVVGTKGHVAVTLSEAVDKATAENATNYTIETSVDGTNWKKLTPIMVTQTNGTTVQVTVAETLAAAAHNNQYRVTVKNVKDLAGNVQVDGASQVLAPAAPVQPGAPQGITATAGTNAGTVKLNNVTATMEYKTATGVWTDCAGTSVDNIAANANDEIKIRVKAEGVNPAGAEATVTVQLANIKPAAAPQAGAVTITQGTTANKVGVNVAVTLEYRVVDNSNAQKQDWTTGTAAAVNTTTDCVAGDKIEVRVKATAQQPASEVYTHTVESGNIGA